MTKTEQNDRCHLYRNLEALGIDYDTAQTLRRISMTLRRWFELECGTENAVGSSISIEREGGTDDGKPIQRVAYHMNGRYQETKTAIPDRETGARKRLAKIMAQHPALLAYVQTDPRGCSLYILHKPGLHDGPKDLARWADSNYTQGIAVY